MRAVSWPEQIDSARAANARSRAMLHIICGRTELAFTAGRRLSAGIQNRTHFVRGAEAERFVQRPALMACMEDHDVNRMFAAPAQRNLHELSRQPSAAVFFRGVHIQDISAARTRADH